MSSNGQTKEINISDTQTEKDVESASGNNVTSAGGDNVASVGGGCILTPILNQRSSEGIDLNDMSACSSTDLETSENSTPRKKRKLNEVDVEIFAKSQFKATIQTKS